MMLKLQNFIWRIHKLLRRVIVRIDSINGIMIYGIKLKFETHLEINNLRFMIEIN